MKDYSSDEQQLTSVKKKETPKIIKIFAIPGMLFFGVAEIVISKLMYQQEAKGRNNINHFFSKPYLQTASMFVGMFLALIIYEVRRLFSEKPIEYHWKTCIRVLIPSICGLVASLLQSIALLFLYSSVWQMLRGSIILFSWLFCIYYLKRKNYPYMTTSIFIIIIGLVLVGVTSVVQKGFSHNNASQLKIIISIFLVIIAQFFQALQTVIEDYLLHDKGESAVLLVGLEGMWGTIFTCGVLMPISQFLPGTEGEGIHEDTIDTFMMMKNNYVIFLFVVIYVILILIFGVFGMYVTEITDAVVRTIFLGLSSLGAWVVMVIIYYSIGLTEYGKNHPDIGEPLHRWSVIELCGFILLFIGTLTYNGIIHLPFHSYDQSSDHEKTHTINKSLLVDHDSAFRLSKIN